MSAPADTAELERTIAELRQALSERETERDAALARRDRDHDERIAHQAATIDVLKAMSASPGDPRPALETIARRAWALCGEQSAVVYSVDGPMMDLVLYHRPNLSAEQAEELRSHFPSPVERNIMAPAITERRILHIRDIDACPGTREVARRFFRSAIWVPMLRGETVIGLIGIDSLEKGGFSDTQIELLRTFAEQAVIAITSAETYCALQTRTADLQESLEYQTATSDVLKAISRSTFDLQPVLDTMMETAARICDADMAFIFRRHGDVYKLESNWGFPPEFEAYLKTQALAPGRASITQRTALEGRIIHVHDMAADPEYALPKWEMAGVRTGLGVPLVRDGIMVGVIDLARRGVRPFSKRQIELVSTFADQAVIAIENTRLLTDQREALERQTAMADVLRTINASPGDLEPVFDTILESAIRLCEAACGMLFTVKDNVAQLAGSRDVPVLFLDWLEQHPVPLDSLTLHGRALREQQTFNVSDARDAAPYRDREPLAVNATDVGGLRSFVLVPMVREGETLGLFTLYRREVRPFSEQNVSLVRDFAAQAVIAMENARLLGALRERTAELAERNTAFAARIDHQAATIDVLKAMSASPGDPQPVFDVIVRRAAEICDAPNAVLFRYDGELLHWQATAGYESFASSEAYQALRRQFPTQPSHHSTLGRTVLTRQVQHVRDIDADPELYQPLRDMGMKSLVGVPLLRDGVPLGGIGLGAREAGGFSDTQIALLETFAEQAVIAITSADTYRALQDRTAELAQRNREYGERINHQAATIDVLKEMSKSPGDAQPVFDLICRQAKALLGTPIVALLEYDGTLVHLRANPGAEDVVGKGPYAAYQDSFPMVPDRGSVSCRAILDRAVVHIRDLAAEPGISETIRIMGYKTQVSIPLMRDGHAVGAISAGSIKADAISDTQIELLKTFAEQAVIAIQSAETWRALQERTAALAQRNSEFGERIEQQAATIDVLKVMSSTPDDTQPVFDQISRRAQELCNSTSAGLMEYRDGLVHLGGIYSASDVHIPAVSSYLAQYPKAPTRDSMVCRAILDSQIIHIRDMRDEPDLPPATLAMVESGFYRSLLVIPLLRDGQTIGCIWLSAAEPGGYTDSQVALLQTFAEQAVIAIGSVATFRALRERTAELAQRNSEFGERIEQQAATIDVLKVMSSTPDDTQPVFDQIVRRARELCNAPSAALFQFDGELVHYRAYALPDDFDDRTDEFVSYFNQFPMAPDPASLTCRAILEKRLIHVRNVEVEPGLSEHVRNALRRIGLRSQVTVPLLRDGAALGAITLNALNTDGFSDSQIALLQTFAEQAVIAIGTVATFRALRERTDELARRQNELRVTFENMGDGVAMFDETQRLVAWNRRFQDIIDVPDDVIAQRRTFPEYIRYLAERGEYGPDADPEEQIRRLTETIGQRRAYERTRPNGTVIEIRNNPVASGGFVIIYADITERKRAETAIRTARDAAETALRDLRTAQDRLIQAEKMASLGQLTAGIAHEIKNPLNFVNNFASLSVELLDELKEAAALAFATLNGDARADVEDLTETLTGNLKKIEEHGKRADGIVRSMLEHSRGSSAERRAVDINALVDEALNLAYHGARAQDQSFNITLERDFAPGIAPIEVNPQDLTRVFLNLFSNGFYAANKRAHGSTDAMFAPTLKVATRQAGDAVEIRVRDNGTGISPDIRDKLFQPFFTTKPTGEGTGLGLSITYDIVIKAHGGTIAVDSEVDGFTEFVVTLPRAGFAAERARA